eukprot:3660042-Pleurochrysis_carterae.AAC.1
MYDCLRQALLVHTLLLSHRRTSRRSRRCFRFRGRDSRVLPPPPASRGAAAVVDVSARIESAMAAFMAVGYDCAARVL